MTQHDGPEPAQNGADAFKGSWPLGSVFPAACIGIVADSGGATRAVTAFLADSIENGDQPGAVAMLGYDPAILDACLKPSIEGYLRCQPGRAETLSRRHDCPPIAVLLPAEDPSLSECASACRRLRSAGVDIRLEVVAGLASSANGTSMGAFGDDVVLELDAFFDDHLDAGFPHMPRDPP